MSKPMNYRTLLTQENAKTIKGEKLGYLTGILYLAPATEAGRGDLCPMSTRGCEEGCLFLAGRASFTPSIVKARLAKTHFYFDNRDAFIASLRYDIAKLTDSSTTLQHGVNVAVVFNVKRGHPLPAQYLGAPVIDGDMHDLRFLDGTRGAIHRLTRERPS